MQGQRKNLSQRELLADKLVNMSIDVTANDREALCQEEGFSKSTISDYLNGTVRDNDTAVKMIQFFQKRINDRYEALNKTA